MTYFRVHGAGEMPIDTITDIHRHTITGDSATCWTRERVSSDIEGAVVSWV